jgi:hypothetical protein
MGHPPLWKIGKNHRKGGPPARAAFEKGLRRRCSSLAIKTAKIRKESYHRSLSALGCWRQPRIMPEQIGGHLPTSRFLSVLDERFGDPSPVGMLARIPYRPHKLQRSSYAAIALPSHSSYSRVTGVARIRDCARFLSEPTLIKLRSSLYGGRFARRRRYA